MKYDAECYDRLYKQWTHALVQISDEERLQTLSSVMRSKLTSLIGTAQILADDLRNLDSLDEDHVQLADTVIQSARFISVILDAAMDMAQQQTSQVS
jgi:signal transduction histidine kinase